MEDFQEASTSGRHLSEIGNDLPRAAQRRRKVLTRRLLATKMEERAGKRIGSQVARSKLISVPTNGGEKFILFWQAGCPSNSNSNGQAAHLRRRVASKSKSLDLFDRPPRSKTSIGLPRWWSSSLVGHLRIFFLSAIPRSGWNFKLLAASQNVII